MLLPTLLVYVLSKVCQTTTFGLGFMHADVNTMAGNLMDHFQAIWHLNDHMWSRIFVTAGPGELREAGA